MNFKNFEITMSYIRFFSFRFLCLLIILGCFTLSNSLVAQNNIYKHLTQRDGLPTGFVYTMFEDDKGFIWTGTNAGISMYDGYTFSNYAPDESDPNAIKGITVYSIKRYDENTLLLATLAGIEILDLKSKEFRLVKIPENLPQPTICFDIIINSSGKIYAVTDVGVFHFPTPPLEDEISEPIFIPSPVGNAGDTITKYVIEFVDEQTVYVGFGTRLGKIDVNTNKLEMMDNLRPEVKDVINSIIWDIHEDTDGDILIAALNGLLIKKKGESDLKLVQNLKPLNDTELRTTGFQSITEDKEGKIYLSTGQNGLIIWDKTNDNTVNLRHNPNNVNSINSDDVHFAFKDSQNLTWFGYHNEGISLAWSNTFKYEHHLLNEDFGQRDSINMITSIYEDDSNTLWFATPEGMVMKDRNGNQKIFNVGDEKLNSESLRLITGLNDEELMVYTDSLKSYYRFNLRNESFNEVSPNSVPRGFDFAVEEIGSNFYFGSEIGKIIKIEKNDYKASTIDLPYPENYTISNRPVVLFAENEDELIVFNLIFIAGGTPKFNIYRYNIQEEEFIKLDLNTDNLIGFGLPTKSKVEDGVYYIRISSGVLKLNINTSQSEILFTDATGVLSMTGRTASIIEDKDGFLWMANPNSLIKLDPFTETISYYDLEDSRKPNFIFMGKQLDNENIIFYGSGGYIEFNPNELQSEGIINYVHITEIKSGEQSYNLLYNNEPIEFNESDTNLSFSFIGLNYRDPNFTKYRYRIKGFNNEWVNIGSQQRVFLANIPSGNYTFELQAAPRFGSFSETTATVDFKIPPPWWRTWPAYLLYALLLIGGFIAFDRIQRQRVIAKERERTREKELKQAKEIELAYENLKATQKKLIQSEKMASLGELTAGIAHEIQNPLNFVNNFSEINQELVDELEAELEKGDIDEAKVIAKDIKQNELKIIHHGKRADSIVKGMLQHSRNHSGEKEPTDINALCDEYLRLAYHGLRAKDKSFNATLESDFDQGLNKVSVVPQDIGRVILNIINNGLYAIQDKKKTTDDPEYKPTIWVSTQKFKDKIIIGIKDNGNGIPEHVRDKIFQPFFTTKSAGDGTGLGLSMSYDIIKAHDGELIVESKEGEGTLFNIELPV